MHRMFPSLLTTVVAAFLLLSSAQAEQRAPESLHPAVFRPASKAGAPPRPVPDAPPRATAPGRGPAARAAFPNLPNPGKAFAEGDFLLTDDPLDVANPVMTAGTDAHFVVAEWNYAENDRDIVGIVIPWDPAAPLIVVNIDPHTSDAFAPAVAFAPDLGLYLVVWEDFEGTVSNIYGAFIDEAGRKVSESFVIVDTQDEEFAPAVAYTGFGDFVVLYGAAQDYTLQTGFVDTYATRVNLDGEGNIGFGEEQLVAQDAAFPAAARVSDEMVAVALSRLYAASDQPFDSWDWDVAVQLVAWDGVPEGAPAVLAETEAAEFAPAIAYNAAARKALVAWEYADGSGPRDIDAGVLPVDPAGSLGTPQTFIAFESPNFDGYPAVAWDDLGGGFLLAWQHDYDGLDGDILVLEFDGQGTPVGGVHAAIQTEAEQMIPAVAALNGWFLVAWQEWIESSFDLVARYYEPGAACTPPPAPANLRASAGASAGQIALAWDPVSGAAGYKVYYGGPAGIPASGGITNTTQLTVSGLAQGQNYCFTVTAYDACGESAPSNQACATVPGGTVTGRVLSIPEGLAPQGGLLEVPVLIDNADGVLSFRVAVCHPAELVFQSVTTGALNTGWTLAVNQESGLAVVSGSGTTALGGSGSIARIRFTVPTSSQGGNLTFCRADLLKLNDGQIPLGTPDAGSYTAPAQSFTWGDLGSVPGDLPAIACDGMAGGLDAALLLRWDAGLTTRLRSCPDNTLYTYPAFPPGADLNGDGIAGGLDASLLLRYDAGLINCFPADLNCDGTGPKAALAQVQRTVALPDALTLPAVGETVAVPVTIDNADGLYSYRLEIQFPAALLEFDRAEAGPLTNGWLGPVVNPGDGTVTLSASGAEAAAGAGELAVLHFLVKAGTGEGALSFGTATRLNDGAVPVATQDGDVTAGAARLEVSPNPAGGYAFGAYAPGETAEAVFTATNTGTAVLQGGAHASGPAFTVTQGQAFTLDPGQSAEVRVRFAPAAEGVHTGTLTFTGDPGGTLVIALQGEGVKRKVFGCSGGGAGGPENRGDLAVIGLTAVLLGLFARRRLLA